MLNKNIFKAYDIRGKYPSEINEKTVAGITEALERYFGKGTIIVGHDARLSSPKLYKTALREIKNEKQKRVIHAVGMVTTPMLYFLVNHFEAAGGIMVTASHNPKKYNGLKVVGPNAIPISGKEIRELVKGL